MGKIAVHKISKSQASRVIRATPKLQDVDALERELDRSGPPMAGEAIAGFPATYAFVLRIICWKEGITLPEITHLARERDVKANIHFITMRLKKLKAIEQAPREVGYRPTDYGRTVMQAWDILKNFSGRSPMQAHKFVIPR